MRFPRFVPFLVCVTLNTFSLFAQSPNGNINGLVSDPSSAAVVGAEVVAVSDVTHMSYTAKTNSEGIYVLPNLPPGPYGVQVSKIGFKTLIKRDITVNIQDSLSINFTLLVGAFHEIVTVEGGAPLVNTESAAVSTVVDQSYVQNMPLNGRSFQDLILLTPGIVTQSPQTGAQLGQEGEFSVNGQRTESNYYTVDGVSANVGASAGVFMISGAGASGSLAASTALGTTQALVSVDDLQEFRVESSTYSAEHGRNPGGQFAFETKSGTNQWHGTAYDYLRNGLFDAEDWFNNYFGTPEPVLRQNDFGGTLGGPVEIPNAYHGKDKTFFFVSYEGLRLAAPQAATANFVPDLCMRGEVAQCPTGREPAATALLPAISAFPLPSLDGIDDTVNGISQYIASWSTPASLNSTSVRFDHLTNDKLRLFFRFSNTTSNSSTRGKSALALTPTDYEAVSPTLRAYTAGASSFFANRVSNEFRLNYTSNEVIDRTVIDAFGGAVPINLAQLSGLSVGSGVGVALAYSGYFFRLNQQQSSGSQRQWNFLDTMSVPFGRHQLKFGVDYRRLAPGAISYTPSLFYYYLSENAVETNSSFNFLSNTAPAHPLYKNFSLFAQDEFRVSKRLSLSFGLRWEVNPAAGVTQGLNAYTVQGSGPSTWALAPQGTPLWQTTWLNFAPRLGAAYILRNSSEWETVVRGGGGVFFDTGQQLASGGFLNGPGFNASTFLPGSFPATGLVIPPILNPPVGQQSIAYGFPTHLQLPYTLQWNGTMEQALRKSQSLTISYVGSHAARLLRENEISTPSNPNASTFLFIQNGLTSDYNALQVQFRRRLERGLTALASYTWSHCIDYGSQNYNYGYLRGNCDFDVRHNLSVAFSYDLPEVGHNSVTNVIVHHWGLDDRFTARTAFPVSLSGNVIVDPATGQYYASGLNLVPGQPVYLYGGNCTSVLRGLGDLSPGKECPAGRAINPLAFADVSSGLGNAPRNFARGFDAVEMDLALRRDFLIHEGLKLQFRVETFNVFNHPNFGLINSTFGQSTFGQATGTLASTLGILSPLYQSGGPRSMQFALKLVF
jgi:Carboxypeptidase regulatory-like domain